MSDDVKPAPMKGEEKLEFEYCGGFNECLEFTRWINQLPDSGLCACGSGHSVFFERVSKSSPAIHWREKHWRLECAFKAALADIQRLEKFITVPLCQDIRSGAALSPAPSDDEAKRNEK